MASYKLIMANIFLNGFFEKKKVSIIFLKNFSLKYHSNINRVITITYTLIKINKNNAIKQKCMYIYIVLIYLILMKGSI